MQYFWYMWVFLVMCHSNIMVFFETPWSTMQNTNMVIVKCSISGSFFFAFPILFLIHITLFRFLSMSSTLKLRKRRFRCYRSSFFQHRNPLECRKYWTTVQKRSEFHNRSWRSNSVVFHLPLWWIQDTYLLMYNISVVQLCIPPTPSEKQNERMNK